MDNWVIIKLFSYLRLRQSCVKQEVDMLQIQKCVTQYRSPHWCSVPNIRKLASVVPEKNVTEIILWENLSMSTIFKVASNRKRTCRRFNCITRYSSPYWCSVPNIRKLTSVVPEKNVTEILCDADADDGMQDDG